MLHNHDMGMGSVLATIIDTETSIPTTICDIDPTVLTADPDIEHLDCDNPSDDSPSDVAHTPDDDTLEELQSTTVLDQQTILPTSTPKSYHILPSDMIPTPIPTSVPTFGDPSTGISQPGHLPSILLSREQDSDSTLDSKLCEPTECIGPTDSSDDGNKYIASFLPILLILPIFLGIKYGEPRKEYKQLPHNHPKKLPKMYGSHYTFTCPYSTMTYKNPSSAIKSKERNWERLYKKLMWLPKSVIQRVFNYTTRLANSTVTTIYGPTSSILLAIDYLLSSSRDANNLPFQSFTSSHLGSDKIWKRLWYLGLSKYLNGKLKRTEMAVILDMEHLSIPIHLTGYGCM